MPIIRAENLTKTFKVKQNKPGLKNSFKSLFKPEYKEVEAVKGISFEVEEGEMPALIGLNGAGKTTTLKILSGLIYPTAGAVEVLGYVPENREKAFLKEIGLLMGSKTQMWWDLPALDSFFLEGEIYDIDRDETAERILDLSEMLDVEDLLRTPVRKLSLGERMKMELILLLLHQPKLLFLDEPTIGLDIISQRTIREFLKEYNQKHHATIIITSHNMRDIEDLCKRIILIDKGELLFDGKTAELKKAYTEEGQLPPSLEDVLSKMLKKEAQ